MNADRSEPEPSAADAAAWQAFRYAAGEMAAAEAQAFEAQMAHDPTICEAVARAVKLGTELVAARPTSADAAPISPRSLVEGAQEQPSRAIAWWSVAAAVCLAFAAGMYAARRGAVEPQPIARSTPHVDSPANVAAIDADAWLRLRDLVAASVPSEIEGDEEASEDLPNLELEIGRGAEVPAWMVDLAKTKQKGKL